MRLTRHIRILRLFLVSAGIFLICVNLAGLLSGDELWPKAENARRSADYEPFSKDMLEQLRKSGSESALDFARRMNTFVYDHTFHHFFDKTSIENLDTVAMPFLKSWPIWLAGFKAALLGDNFVVEFCDAERGLERGFGFCSQRALILKDILRKNGLDAHVRKMYGHVVCMVHDGSREILLDPDYGFAIPHSLEYLHEHPDILRNYNVPLQVVKLYEPLLKAARWRERGDKPYHCRGNGWLLAMSLIQWGVPLLLLLLGWNLKRFE